MDERTEGSFSRRKDADFRKCEPVSDNLMDNRNNNAHNGLEMDKQNEIRPEKVLHRLPYSNSQYQLKKYSRTLSETSVGSRPVANSAKLKRVLSATELRTRLAGCPKGLLIATEPPRSGESYRRRSNTDVRAVLRKNVDSQPSKQEISELVYQENTDLQLEKETILVELETVKRERKQLQQENERLQEELENRNKVIDHLIDFMKSSLPGETRPLALEDDFSETLTNNNN